MSVEKETLKELLKSNVVEVKFTKLDGNIRTMLCTLQETLLPEVTTSGTKKVNDEVLSVWDIDNSGWRSFRFENVITYGIKNDVSV